MNNIPDDNHEYSQQEYDQEIADLEKTVHEHGRSGLKAGESLKKIKSRKLYKCKGFKTWGTYCKSVFGFSMQYANRLIAAWECHGEQEQMFHQKGRHSDFGNLPGSVNFWEQASRLEDKDKCLASLESLLEEGQLSDDWAAKWSEALKGDRKTDEAAGADEDDPDIKGLARNIFSAIEKSGCPEIKEMPSKSLKALFKELARMFTGHGGNAMEQGGD